MEKIADVLVKKYPQFNTIAADCLVSDALYQMCCENVDFLIVLENEKFQGVISDHAIAGKVLSDDRPLNRIPVREFMIKTLPVATSDDSLEYSMQLMERYNVQHLVIFDGFYFKGVISTNDLLHEALLDKRTAAFDGAAHVSPAHPWDY